MCYMTILSTATDADLSAHNNELVTFSAVMPAIPEERYLAHPFKWFIGSRDGCSCALRHLYVSSCELGFGEPEEWYPEEAEDIEATRQIAATIRALVHGGAQVDCVDAWAQWQEGAAPLAGELTVKLSEVGDASFRFFEMHRFVLSNELVGRMLVGISGLLRWQQK